MKILVIQLAKMGDIIQSFPLIRALKKNDPNTEICLLHSELFSETLDLINEVKAFAVNLDLLAIEKDGILSLAEGTYTAHILHKINSQHFDMIINLNSSQLSAGITALADCPVKRGFSSGYEADEKWLSYILSFMKTRHLASFNLVDIFLRIGQGPELYSSRLLRSEDNLSSENLTGNKITSQSTLTKERNYRLPQICLQLGSRNSKRHPLMKDYVAIANRLIANGYQIILTGVSSELPLYHAFITQIDKPDAIINKIGETSLSELYHILNESEFLISSDTGTMHLASLTKCRIFAIFMGCAFSYETLAYKSDTVVFFPNHDQISCYPCSEFSPCPNHFICKELQTEIVTDYILMQKPHESLYQCIYDSMGQYLVPIQKRNISEYQFYALIWRFVSAEYFYHIRLNLSDYSLYFHIDPQFSVSCIKQIKREISLAKLTKSENTDISSLPDNYHFLNPLLIYNLFYPEFEKLLFVLEETISRIMTD